MKQFKTILTIILVAFLQLPLQATHIFGGDITYQQIGTNTYEVELSLLRNCNGILAPSFVYLQISSLTCGVQTVNLNIDITRSYHISPLCPSEPDRCDTVGGIWGIQQQYYTGIINLPCIANDYVLSWSTCCRNNSATTFSGGSSSIYINANLDNTINNSSPQYSQTFQTNFNTNQRVNYSRGVSDPDGDSLVFSLVDCRIGPTSTLSYFSNYSGTNPVSTQSGFNIDATTGNMTFYPTSTQVSVLCVLVEEYRNGLKIGEIISDLQFSTYPVSNNRPMVSGINGTASLGNGITGDFDTTICAGQTLTFDVATYDRNITDLLINSTPQNLNLYINDVLTGATLSVDTTGTYPVGTFQWTPTANDVGLNVIDIIIEDDACPIHARNAFSFKITVKDYTDLTPYSDTAIFCINGGPTLLQNFYPTNAIWSHWTGQGITDSLQGIFDPSVAGLGNHDLTFLFYNLSIGVCSNSETFTAKVIGNNSVDLGVDQSICYGNNTLTLSNQLPKTGIETWSGSGVNHLGVFSPNISGVGVHSIILTDSTNNCLSRDTINITVYNVNNAYAGVDTGLCKNDTIQLAGMPNGGFWTGTGILDSSGLFSLANSTQDGSFPVFYNYLDTNMCLNMDMAVMTVSKINIDAGNDFTMCLADSLMTLQLSAYPVGGIWQGTNIDPSTGILNISNVSSGSQFATYTFSDSLGCTLSDTIQMTFFDVPAVSAGVNVSVCESATLQLNGSPNGGAWIGNGVDPMTGIFNPTNLTGIIPVLYGYLDSNNCGNIDTALVTIVPHPTVEAGAPDTLFATDNPLVLSGYFPSSGFWTGQGIIDGVAGIFNPILVGQGNYILTYKFDDGTCITTDTKDIYVDFGVNTAKVFSDDAIKIFPNPFENTLNIHFEKMPSDAIQIRLLNELGQVIVEKNIPPTLDYILKIKENLVVGIYFLELEIDGKQSVLQVMKR